MEAGNLFAIFVQRIRMVSLPTFVFSFPPGFSLIHSILVPPEYFCNLDMSGRRMDLAQRPELLHGAIEFKAPKEYYSRPPVPCSYVFAIDVSWNSLQWGMAARAVSAIKDLLYGGGQSLPAKCKVGIITFDKSVHFYNLKVWSSLSREWLNSHFFFKKIGFFGTAPFDGYS
jgi:hypothetical protein